MVYICTLQQYEIFQPSLSCCLMFNYGNTQEFKNQVFLYANIHGQTPAFPAVASNVFPAVT